MPEHFTSFSPVALFPPVLRSDQLHLVAQPRLWPRCRLSALPRAFTAALGPCFLEERERERDTHTHTHTHTHRDRDAHTQRCVRAPLHNPPHTHTHAPGDAAVHNNCDAATVVLHHEQTRQAHQLRHRPCGECVPYRSTSTAKQRKSLLLASHTHRNTSEAGASSAPLHSSRLAITNTRLPLFSPPPQKKIQPTALWFSKVQLPWTLAQFFLPYNTQAWVIHLGIFSCASQIGQERGQERSRERSRDREREIERETDTQALTRGMLTRTAC